MQKQKLADPIIDSQCKVTMFATTMYDKVKHTVATRKSYIQYYDHDEQRWKCLFSSTAPEHRTWSEFMVDQMKDPHGNLDKFKEIARMFKLGQLKVPQDWCERGVVFGGESADSRSMDSAMDED